MTHPPSPDRQFHVLPGGAAVAGGSQSDTNTTTTPAPAGRRLVRVGSDPDTIRRLTTELDGGLIPETYVTDGTPVTIEAVSGATTEAPTAGDEDAPPPVAVTGLKPSLLAALLAAHAEVMRPTPRGGDEEVTPATPVLAAVLAKRSWPGLAPLRRVITTPVLRPDGTLLQEPGYDPRTGYYLASSMADLGPINPTPTPQAVAAAREFLLDRFLMDFPWATPADRANYIALMATPILRHYLRTLVPFAIVDATMPGSGKTILTSCIGLMVGQKVYTWPKDGDSEGELRKIFTTELSDGVGAGGVVVFDNLAEGTVIDSAVLARLVTERTWTDRRLGTNSTAGGANDRLWLATGNNLRTGGDIATRAVWVRLDPDCPQPEARTGFAIPHLDSWVLDPANRAIVLRALLTLILDWINTGAPVDHSVPAMRQFTRWAQALGGFLTHHHIGHFLANHDDNKTLDDDAAEWRAFLHRWRTLHPVDQQLTAHQLRTSAEPDHGIPDPWDGAFPTLGNGRLPTVKQLGRRLTGQIGRWRGDIVLRAAIDPTTNARTYWTETTTGTSRQAPHDTTTGTAEPDGREEAVLP
ncbi:MAG: hypothetical protein ACRCYU_18260 [Nocardioides sp.]